MNTISSHKNKILIVDDQHKNIQVLGSILRQENYIIGVATNGKQALDALSEANDYDLVLLDVNMPVMDGFEACIAIRKQEKLKDIPIIFLTAMVDAESIVKGFMIGGQDYVTKPFNSNELLARVGTQLELKQRKDELKQMNDLLEIKVAERTEELNIANQKLLQLDAAKSEFLNIISHEIRTPLNGILGILSILNEFEIEEEVREMLDILDSSAIRLEEFSMKALDISLLNINGVEALKFEETNIHELISFQINNAKEKASLKNISLIEKNETTDTFTMLDETYIHKCFSHLIDNAIKFGKENSEVIINKSSSNGNFIITIEDEGVPFPENYNTIDIGPFRTISHIDNDPGLSLYISKQIVELHMGTLEIKNTTNGARITLSIPIS